MWTTDAIIYNEFLGVVILSFRKGGKKGWKTAWNQSCDSSEPFPLWLVQDRVRDKDRERLCVVCDTRHDLVDMSSSMGKTSWRQWTPFNLLSPAWAEDTRSPEEAPDFCIDDFWAKAEGFYGYQFCISYDERVDLPRWRS